MRPRPPLTLLDRFVNPIARTIPRGHPDAALVVRGLRRTGLATVTVGDAVTVDVRGARFLAGALEGP